jgi:hypothetical protein
VWTAAVAASTTQAVSANALRIESLNCAVHTARTKEEV